jgi:hypothetical protein
MALESASWDSNPEFALTQFRLSLAWMQAATRNTPAESPIHQIMKDPERTNDVERAVWTALRGKT